jgi:hypothetical protein
MYEGGAVSGHYANFIDRRDCSEFLFSRPQYFKFVSKADSFPASLPFHHYPDSPV